jgi:hypothetical protein
MRSLKDLRCVMVRLAALTGHHQQYFASRYFRFALQANVTVPGKSAGNIGSVLNEGMRSRSGKHDPVIAADIRPSVHLDGAGGASTF